MPGQAEIRVEAVPRKLTLALRQRVLRPHQRLEELGVPGELDPGAVHLAALLPDGTVVGTAVLLPERFAPMPDRADAWRLRAMATDERWRGRGVGRLVLDRAVEHVAARGGGLLWCHARVPARAFYTRAGFTVVGEPWQEPFIGPHVAMYREVTPAGAIGAPEVPARPG